MNPDPFKDRLCLRSFLQDQRKHFILVGLILGIHAGLFSQETITFEEFTPQTVVNQYCENLATNRGVQFKSGVAIREPQVPTASGTQALMELSNGGDENPFGGPSIISFTSPQSFVEVQVGLDFDRDVPVTAILRAYDHPEPNQGNKLTPSPDPSVNLGTGPIDITQLLSFGSMNGPANIRRIEIECFVPNNFSAVREIIDDLRFSSIGPSCAIDDTDAPTAEILLPQTNQDINNPQALFHFRATDDESGLKSIRIAFLDQQDNEMAAFYYCGEEPDGNLCPGFPNSNQVEAQFYTHFPVGTQSVQLLVSDWAGNNAQDEVNINFALPDQEYNIWALGMEVTQVIQDQVPSSTISRSITAPEVNLNLGPPLVAGKRTIVRVYPGVENTSVSVVGARANLSCFTSLGATPGSGTPCDGPLGAEALNPEITIDPANGNDLNALRMNTASSWNFLLPPEWTTPGEVRWLVAKVRAPANVPECGDILSGCDDGANFFISAIPAFQETAPIIIQPRFGCVRRTENDEREDCDAIAPTIESALDLAGLFLWGNDWDNDDLLDPFFNHVMPIADGINGIKIEPANSLQFDYRDADFASGDMTRQQLSDYLFYIGDEFIWTWGDILDPEWAVAFPPNFRRVAFVPMDNAWVAGASWRGEKPAVVKVDRTAVWDNDFCPGCLNDPEFTFNFTEPTIAHEIGHTFGIRHAGCGYGEDNCDPAPGTFPCPDGGICLSDTELDEPKGFNTFNLNVLPPRDEAGRQAHDYMSYGPFPTWTSRHTYGKIFQDLRGIWEDRYQNRTMARRMALAAAPPDSSYSVLYVSGAILPSGEAEIQSVYQLTAAKLPTVGSGSHLLELHDVDGNVLSSRRFEPIRLAEEEEGNSHFFQFLPYTSQPARVVLKEDETILAERARSLNAPALTIGLPAAGEIWTEELRLIRWRASDADQDPLTFVVQYSNDQGQSWSALKQGWTENQLEVNVNSLAGGSPGSALIRILASDGFNTTIATSEAFTVPDRFPSLRIYSPRKNFVFEQYTFINFIGAAIDLEDGTLEESAYTWTSSLDGLLGRGHELRLSDLSLGEHRINLSAIDSHGNSAEASIKIKIVRGPNHQPVALSKNQITAVGEPVILDGQASYDLDEDSLRYAWKFLSFPSLISMPPALSKPETPTPQFVPEVPGTYVLELRVHDGELTSLPIRVQVEARNKKAIFLYTIKMVCGENEQAGQLAPGHYATGVDLYNPQDSGANVNLKFSLPSEEGTGAIWGAVEEITITAQMAFHLDCLQLERLFFPEGVPTSPVNGLLVIESPASLDVRALYTAGASSSDVPTLEVIQVEERKRLVLKE